MEKNLIQLLTLISKLCSVNLLDRAVARINTKSSQIVDQKNTMNELHKYDVYMNRNNIVCMSCRHLILVPYEKDKTHLKVILNF